jgi:hypothetical protein
MNTCNTNAKRGGVRHRRLVSGACLAALVGGLLWMAGPSPANAAAAAWSIVPSPNQGTRSNSLYGVSCTSSSLCTAVGYYETSSRPFIAQTLIESWNGTSWSIVSSPNEGTGNNSLYGVSCVSSSSCTGVGDYVNSSGINQTLIESWNGTKWSIVSSPSKKTSTSALNNGLKGVSCASSSLCTAVGYYDNSSGIHQTLIESWNGTKWSIVSSPSKKTSTSALNNGLSGVSCASSSLCTAVGYYDNSTGTQLTLAESWNGTKWSIVSSPSKKTSTSALNNGFSGVSCASSSLCTAVGGYVNSSGTVLTLAESWNGTKWSIVSSPNKATSNNDLQGVSCTSSSSCTAVGNYGSSSTPTQALIESWNGTKWSTVTSPNEGTGDYLYGVSCVSSSSCTAVGQYTSSSTSPQTLIESDA